MTEAEILLAATKYVEEELDTDDKEIIEAHINAVQLFCEKELWVDSDQETIEFALSHFIGRYEKPEDYIEEMLEIRGVEDELNKIKFSIGASGETILSVRDLNLTAMWDWSVYLNDHRGARDEDGWFYVFKLR